MTPPGSVMVVDDDAEIREMVALVLELNGYAAIEATDGADALRRLDHGSDPSLILLDLRMPRMNGIEFLKALRADPLHARIPVVVLTGDTRAIPQAVEAGSDACLSKPVDTERLLSMVGRFSHSPQ